MAANPFTETGKEFIPAAEFKVIPLAMTKFTPFVTNTTTNSYLSADDQVFKRVVSADKYKTVVCKSWKTNTKCSYGRKCQYAHSQDELRVVDHSTHNCR